MWRKKKASTPVHNEKYIIIIIISTILGWHYKLQQMYHHDIGYEKSDYQEAKISKTQFSSVNTL